MHKSSILYSSIRFLVRFMFRQFYRKIIVTGQENIPTKTPLILAPNHQNALMDPLAVIFTNPLKSVYLARADLFKSSFSRSILTSFRMLPVYRVRDGIGNVERNDETFDGTTQILEANESVAVFPEAQHHGARFLLPIKKGVPRIAFLAEEKTNFQLDVQVVPVGINFSNYGNFRSVLQVNYGKVIPVKQFQAAYEEAQVKGFNALRDALSDGMRPLMIDIQDKVHYGTIDKLRKIYNKEMQVQLGLNINDHASWFKAEKAIIKYFDSCEDSVKQEISLATERFLAQCDKCDIKYSIASSTEQSTRQLTLKRMQLLVLFPLFLIGYLVGLIPYALSEVMQGKVKDKQFDSTFRFVISLLALPLFYGIYSALFSSFLSIGWWGLLIFRGLFPLGTFALDYKRWWSKLNNQTRWQKMNRKEDNPLMNSKKVLFDLLKVEFNAKN